MRMIGKLSAIALCILDCGCETTNTAVQPSKSPADPSAYVQSSSKFSFPKSVGSFQRVDVKKYDQTGNDVGVGYDDVLPVAATVYVYPAPRDFALVPAPKLDSISQALLDSHFKTCEREVLSHHPDAKSVSEDSFKLVQGTHTFVGKKAMFTLDYNFGLSSQPCVSELYVFLIEPGALFLLDQRQFVKYRITYPIDKQEMAEAKVKRFMTDLSWPIQ